VIDLPQILWKNVNFSLIFATGIQGTYIFKNKSTTQTSVPECDPSQNIAWYEPKFERI